MTGAPGVWVAETDIEPVAGWTLPPADPEVALSDAQSDAAVPTTVVETEVWTQTRPTEPVTVKVYA